MVHVNLLYPDLFVYMCTHTHPPHLTLHTLIIQNFLFIEVQVRQVLLWAFFSDGESRNQTLWLTFLVD